MNDIKSRGKRVDNRKWIYGYYSVVGNRHFIIQSNAEVFKDYKDIAIQYVIEVIPETVGLYNSRYDIWQGDIVEVKTKRVSLGQSWYQTVSQYDGNCVARCIVEFDGNQFKFNWDTEYNRAILANRGKETDSREFQQYDITNTSLWKKIGNIHEHPELLKGQSNVY